MKLNITILYGERKVKLLFSVGRGEQTFKWLAFAVARRFEASAPCGRLRHRNYCFNVPANVQLIPKDVYTMDCPFFHPDYFLKDHLQDASNVTIELYDKMPVDKHGMPMYSKWSFIALHTSKSREKERQRTFNLHDTLSLRKVSKLKR